VSSSPLARLRTLFSIDAELPPAERAGFDEERVQHNLRRIRAFVPVMFFVHVGHVLALRVGEGAGLSAAERAWHEELSRNNAVMIPISALIVALAWRERRPAPWFQRWLGELTFVAYQTHAAISTVVDQHITASVHAFIIGALAPAVVFRVGSLAALAAYASGLAALWVGTGSTQPSESLRLSNLAGALTVAAVGFVLARTMSRAMARQTHDQNVIEDKTRALSAANADLEAIKVGLEARVAEQVKEIVAHADEVQRLNAQLMERVQERSAELSKALAQLAGRTGVQDALRAGDEIGGRVVIERLLGQGGMGAVYAGRDRVSDREVAVKIVRASSADELDALQRFLREARTAASLTHPAIVRSLHVDVDAEGRFFQILELVRGETLGRRVHEVGPLSPGHAARVGAVLADALASAHAAGVVHRDVKPQNVMLTTEPPGVKLLDFGIAKAPELRGHEASRTQSGVIVGTPEFIAPEQIERPSEVTPASDVYALGLVVFHVATGKLAFEGAGGPAAYLYAHIAMPPTPLDEVLPGAPKALVDLVARCLEKRPDARPGARDVCEALTAIADAEGAPDAIAIARPRAAAPTSAAPEATTRAS
jgi:serine/threonine-protein kinase